MGSELKYTDRDVRENPGIHLTVEQYLEQYTGEFEYLIDMKMRVARGVPLTVAMVRGVLNCMRHDPRVTNLPEPMPSEFGVVIDMEEERPKRTAAKKRKLYVSDLPCRLVGNTEHRYHRHETDTEEGHCPGWWRIEREFAIGMDVKVHVERYPYVVARSGALIHRVHPDGPHEAVWHPNTHRWGWHGLYDQPEFVIKTWCKYPSYILKARMLTEVQAGMQVEASLRQPCRHCGLGG